MKILRAYKTELNLNNKQRTLCMKHAGAARFAYNWGLAQKIQAYQNGEKTPNAIDLHKKLNQLKKSELSWMYEVSKTTPQEALRNLDRAYDNFFRRVKAKNAGKYKGAVGVPKFKSKKTGIGNFQIWGSIHVFEKAIQLPRFGKIRLKESGYLPIDGAKILYATVSEKAGRWIVSLQCEVDVEEPTKNNSRGVCGVDLGIKTLATVSDGTQIENPKALKTSLDKIKRLQRTVSRRKKGSENRKKAVRKLAQAYARVENVRKNALHQATTWLAKNKSVVVLETLNVDGMKRNRKLAQAISDVGFYEFNRQLQYKGAWYGCEVVLADPFFPSSKTCSRCGHKKDELSLSERAFHCEKCGVELDRDLNAAINLEKLATTTASSAGSHACGEDVRPASLADLDETGTKQQISNVQICIGF